MPPSRGISPLVSSLWCPGTSSRPRLHTWQREIRRFSTAPKKFQANEKILRRCITFQSCRTRLCTPWAFSQSRLNSTSSSSGAFVQDEPTQSEEGLLPDSTNLLDSASETVRYTNDYMGFLLQDYAIDFGWGTSNLLKTLFEAVHVYSGLPFWGSILITGCIIRLVMVPATSSSVENATRLRSVMPVTRPLMEQLKVATQARDHAAMQRIRMQMKQVYQDVDIKMWRFALPLIQLPLGFGCWRTFWAMAHAPVVGLDTGGIAWFTNLTIADPFYILPVATAVISFTSVRTAQENQAVAGISEQQQTMQKYMTYGIPISMLLVTGTAPAAVQLHFLCTNILALGSNFMFRNTSFRKWMGVTRNPKPVDSQQEAYKGTITVSGASSQTGLGDASSSSSASRSGVFSKLAGAASAYKSARHMIKGYFPGAKRDASKRIDKQVAQRQRKRAKEYEARRSKEIEEERVEWEQEQQDYRTSTRRKR